MTEVERLAVETEVAAAVPTTKAGMLEEAVEMMTAYVMSIPDDAERLAVATYLASGEFSAWASDVADGLIVTFREENPLDTYEVTAGRLGVSYAAVARAVTRHRTRHAAPDSLVRSSYGFVYFASEADDGPIKIGHALNPATRVKSLQAGHPRELVLLGQIRSDDANLAEKALHKQLASSRIRGEWFSRTPELMDLIASQATDRFGVPVRERESTS